MLELTIAVLAFAAGMWAQVFIQRLSGREADSPEPHETQQEREDRLLVEEVLEERHREWEE